jgi:hypothetical protein
MKSAKKKAQNTTTRNVLKQMAKEKTIIVFFLISGLHNKLFYNGK